ncbi:hypothetical protein [Labrys okinawensis]|uniref:hypothetical protein n=1 Tax=Labrys okinawensis TaxID=346911 RepID=UPI0011B272E0|nr:hypothetical protein [Labrys okinawensis]
MEYKTDLHIVNSAKHNLLVILEPFAEFFTLEPDEHLTITGVGGEPGDNFEIQYAGKYVMVHAWPNSIATVYRDGVELDPEDQVFPRDDP